MKWLKLSVAGAILAFSAVCEGAELREFVTKDGESIYGEIRDYSKETDTLKLYTDAGQLTQMKAAQLRDEDFIYVRDWDAARKFEQNADFRLYLDEYVEANEWTKYRWLINPGKVEPSKTHETDFERIYYPIRFHNVTGYDLENVEIKYCIFYSQERMDWTVEEKVNEVKVRPCIDRYPIIPNGANEKTKSKSVVLRRKLILAGDDRWYFLEGEGRKIRSEMIGIILRMTLNTRSGITVTRERKLPIDLSEEYVWVEPTEENTEWPDDELDGISDMDKPPTPFELMGGVEESGE